MIGTKEKWTRRKKDRLPDVSNGSLVGCKLEERKSAGHVEYVGVDLFMDKPGRIGCSGCGENEAEEFFKNWKEKTREKERNINESSNERKREDEKQRMKRWG